MIQYETIMQVESQFAFLPGIGNGELLLILFIILLLFGAKKLPELARGLGKSMKEFKKATSEIEDDFRTAMDAKPEVKAAPKAPAAPAAPVEEPQPKQS